jgi:hypothetical protein
VKVKDLRPNPFRRLEEYPIDREKVEVLKESIAATGFWGTIVGRQVVDWVEIAFGHHRLVAIRETHEGSDEVEIIVRSLTNEQMVQIMAQENREEWGASIWTYVETVQATIAAYGRGEIALPPVPKKTRQGLIRHVGADSFPHPYTKGTIAQFLGWVDRKEGERLQPNYHCDVAFQVIDLMAAGLLDRATILGLKRMHHIDELTKGIAEIHESWTAATEREAKEAERAGRKAAEAADEDQRRDFEAKAEEHRSNSAAFRAEATRRVRQFGQEASKMIHRDAEEPRSERGRKSRTQAIRDRADSLRFKTDAELAARQAEKDQKRLEAIERHIRKRVPDGNFLDFLSTIYRVAHDLIGKIKLALPTAPYLEDPEIRKGACEVMAEVREYVDRLADVMSAEAGVAPASGANGPPRQLPEPRA